MIRCYLIICLAQLGFTSWSWNTNNIIEVIKTEQLGDGAVICSAKYRVGGMPSFPGITLLWPPYVLRSYSVLTIKMTFICSYITIHWQLFLFLRGFSDMYFFEHGWFFLFCLFSSLFLSFSHSLSFALKKYLYLKKLPLLQNQNKIKGRMEERKSSFFLFCFLSFSLFLHLSLSQEIFVFQQTTISPEEAK